MKSAAFILMTLAVLFALANVIWGHGFDGRSFLALILFSIAVVLWVLSPAHARRS